MPTPLIRLALASTLALSGALAQSPFGTFVEPLPVSSNAAVEGLTGDLDGDGRDDLVVVADQPGIARVYLSSPNGSLEESPAAQPFVADVHQDGALLDVDGDGDLDLLLVGIQAVRLYLNQGGGSFAPSPIALPGHPLVVFAFVETADVNGDGVTDVYLGTGFFDLLWLCDGIGGFVDVTATHLQPIGAPSAAVHFADLDGINGPDMILAIDGGTAQLRFHANNGAGVFTTATLPVTWTGRYHELRHADLDGDGDQDLVVVAGPPSSQPVSVLVNLGGGAYAAPVLLGPAGATAYELVVDDMDGDGTADIVATILGVGQELWTNGGAANFYQVSAPEAFRHPLDPAAMVPGDWDGDGATDLYFARRNDRDTLVFNLGGGTFLDDVARLPRRFGNDFRSGDVADLTGDGFLDIVVQDRFTGPQLWVNDGSERFVDETATRLPPLSTANGDQIHALDPDGDGDTDLFVLNEGSLGTPSRMLINDGTGQFSDQAAAWMPGFNPGTPFSTAGDVDGDGLDDVVVSLAASNIVVLRSTGTSFNVCGPCVTPQPFFQPTRLELADFDGDGDQDLVTLALNRIELFDGDGAGNFTNLTGPAATLGANAWSLAVGDVSGDGLPDLVVSDTVAIQWVLINNGNGTFSDQSFAWWPVSLERVRDLELADVDLDGRLDVIVARGRFHPVSPEPEANLVFLADAQGRFTGAPIPFEGDYEQVTEALLVADLDEDYDPDVVALNNGKPARLSLATRYHAAFRGPARAFRPIDIRFSADPLQAAFLLVAIAPNPPRIPFPPFGIWKLGAPSFQYSASLLDATGQATGTVQLSVPAGITLHWQTVFGLPGPPTFLLSNVETTTTH